MFMSLQMGILIPEYAPGTQFKDLPGDWQCPTCGVSTDEFEKEE